MKIYQFMDTMERILQLEALRDTEEWTDALEVEWTRLREIKLEIDTSEDEKDSYE